MISSYDGIASLSKVIMSFTFNRGIRSPGSGNGFDQRCRFFLKSVRPFLMQDFVP